MAELTWYFNGKWVPGGDVKIDPTDRGFMVGDTVFEASRTFNGKGFRLKQHVDRLYRSLKYVRMDPGLSPEEMLEVHEEAIRRNEKHLAELGDLMLHPFITRGIGRWTHDAGPPNLCVRVAQVDFGRYAHLYGPGAHSVITRTGSYSPEALDPKVKHYSRMNFALAELEANDVDPGSWPILRDVDGNITEGSGYNAFIVTGGVIRTPTDRAALQGVSRGMVFELAKQLNIPLEEGDLQPYDVYTSDEAFFSTTSPCVVPFTVVDRREIGDGKPGAVTQQLLAAWSEAVGVDIVDQALRFAGPE